MALANKAYTRMYSTTGSDSDLLDSREITKMESQFTNNEYLEDKAKFEQQGMLIVQIQKLMDELDELRRYITSAELLVDAGGRNLPTDSRGLSSGDLYNDRGTVKIA